jgi:hypothetical protein
MIPKFEVRRTELEFPPGYNYLISFEDKNRPEGDACLIVMPFGNIRDEEFYLALEKEGIGPNDMVAFLQGFSPNGLRADELRPELTRKGVGTSVLEIIMNDARSYNAKIMYSYTHKESMKGFLIKNNFTVLDITALRIKAYKRID